MEKPALVFLHGWQQDHHTWDRIITGLKNQYQCLAPDLPGFGQEKLSNKNWGITEYAKWVNDFSEKNKLESYVLIGHSFGGRIATVIAKNNPKVSKLILYATPAIKQPLSWPQKFRSALIEAIKKSGLPKDKIPFYPIIADKFRSEDRRKAGPLTTVFENTINFDLRPYLIDIKQPTLLIWGEDDSVVPISVGNEILRMVRGATLKIIPNGSHFAHLDNPELFCGIIRSWIGIK